MPVCDLCGAPIDLDGYHVVVGGRRFDSMECALRATARPGRSDEANAWVAAARERLGVTDEKPLSESEDNSTG